jgi:hypothetical protein
VCDGYEPVKSPAKKITDTNSQYEINQSQHTQILADLTVSAGANPKRAISSVKHGPEFLERQLPITFSFSLTRDQARCRSRVWPWVWALMSE